MYIMSGQPSPTDGFECADESTNGQNGRTNGPMNGPNGPMNGPNERTKWTNERTKWTDQWTNERTNEWTNGPMNVTAIHVTALHARGGGVNEICGRPYGPGHRRGEQREAPQPGGGRPHR